MTLERRDFPFEKKLQLIFFSVVLRSSNVLAGDAETGMFWWIVANREDVEEVERESLELVGRAFGPRGRKNKATGKSV